VLKTDKREDAHRKKRTFVIPGEWQEEAADDLDMLDADEL
jgi:hypothetical protein